MDTRVCKYVRLLRGTGSPALASTLKTRTLASIHLSPVKEKAEVLRGPLQTAPWRQGKDRGRQAWDMLLSQNISRYSKNSGDISNEHGSQLEGASTSQMVKTD